MQSSLAGEAGTPVLIQPLLCRCWDDRNCSWACVKFHCTLQSISFLIATFQCSCETADGAGQGAARPVSAEVRLLSMARIRKRSSQPSEWNDPVCADIRA